MRASSTGATVTLLRRQQSKVATVLAGYIAAQEVYLASTYFFVSNQQMLTSSVEC